MYNTFGLFCLEQREIFLRDVESLWNIRKINLFTVSRLLSTQMTFDNIVSFLNGFAKVPSTFANWFVKSRRFVFDDFRAACTASFERYTYSRFYWHIRFMPIMQRRYSCDMYVTVGANFARFRILDSSTADITVTATSSDNPFVSARTCVKKSRTR